MCMFSTANAQLTVTTSPSNSTCGTSDGSIISTVSGGTSPYTYLWDDPGAQTSANAYSLAAGKYTVTVTDAGAATVVGSDIVNDTGAPTSTISSVTNVSCFGGSDGSATVAATGGTTPYTYLWSTTPAQTTATATGLSATTYNVSVTDGVGCISGVDTTLTEPADLIGTTSGSAATCNGNCDGTATVSVTGGVSPYTFLWNDPLSQSTATAINLCAGTYTATTTDANGCIATSNYTVIEPLVLSTTTSGTDPTCNGGCDGNAAVSVSGGTSPYTYSWNTTPVQTNATATGLCAGTYTVTVTDANGCTDLANHIVNDPPVYSSNAGPDATICEGVVYTLSGSIGGGASTSTWSSSGTGTFDDPSLLAATYTPSAGDIAGGLVSLTLTASGICPSASDLMNLTIDPLPTANAGTDATICESTTHTLSGSMGGGASSITWTTSGTGTFDNASLLAATYTPSGADASAGTVTLTITTDDPFGPCTAASDLMVLTIDQVPTTAAAGADQSLCNVTTATLAGNTPVIGTAVWTVISGTAVVTTISDPTSGVTGLTIGGSSTFRWTTSNGVCVSSIDDVIITSDASPTIANAGPDQSLCNVNTTTLAGNTPAVGIGNWTVISGTGTITTPSSPTSGVTGMIINTVVTLTWTISNGVCPSSIDTLVITVYPAATTNAGADATICAGDTYTLAGTIGGGASTSAWTTSGTGTFDDPTLLAATYTPSAADTTSGSVTLTLTTDDPAGPCTAASDFMVVTINSSPSAGFTYNGNQCLTGNVFVFTNTGSAGQSYFWDFGDGGVGTSVVENPSYTYLASGTFSVIQTITDGGGCTASTTIPVIVFSEPIATLVSTDESCAGSCDGSIDLTPSGGAIPYTYTWSTSAITEDITALCAGPYSVVVDDVNGCSTTGSDTISSPVAVTLTSSGTDVSCNGLSDGTATVSVVTGTSPYTYLWNDPATQTTATAVGLAAGTYTATVTDFTGCSANQPQIVNEPAAISTILTKLDVNCNGYCDGNLNASVSGGVFPYTYSWNGGSNPTNPLNTGLCASITYQLTVTDSNGCSDIATDVLTEPIAISATATSTDVSTCGVSDGSISLTVTGGIAPLTYLWSNGSTAQNPTGLPAGSYSVTIIDSTGCAGSASSSVGEPPVMTLSTVSTTVTCSGGNDGTVDLTVTGGATPHTFAWSDGSTSEDLSNAAEGTYTVTVIDAVGCTASSTVTVSAIAPMTLSLTSLDATSCGANDASAIVSVSGGTTPYTYTWSNGDTTSTASALPSGIHYVSIVDANSCIAYGTVTISESGGPTISITSIVDNVCSGDASGAVNVSVTGGAPPYSYIWSHGATTGSISNLIGAIYELTVEDTSGCVATVSATINEPTALTISSTTTDASCSGTDGSASISVSGSTPPYTYLWSNAGTTSSQTGLAAGVYSVITTDSNGCSESISVVINNLGGPTITADSVNHVNCDFPNNGAINISVSGGFTPYTYLWSTGDTIEDLSNLSDTTYNLTVSDANGCVAATSVEVEYQAPTNVEICIITVDSLTGKNLIVWEKDPGASIDYYNIYKEGTQANVYFLLASVPYDSLSTYVDTLADPLQRSWRYKITAGDTCINNIESELSPMHKSIHLTVNQGIGGEINLIWDHYEGFAFGTYVIYRGNSFSTMDSINAVPSNLHMYTDQLPPGGQLFYQVAAVHPSGCTASKGKNYNSSKSNTTNIFVPTTLAATISITNTNPDTCNGTATVNATDGAEPYTYQWDSNTGNQTDSTAVGLCMSSYSVTVTDANGDSLVLIATVGTSPGIFEQKVFGEVKLFPNPSRGIFNLTIENQLQNNAIVRVYDVLGEVIYTSIIYSNNTELDLSNNRPGIYIVKIQTDEGSITKKMIIE